MSIEVGKTSWITQVSRLKLIYFLVIIFIILCLSNLLSVLNNYDFAPAMNKWKEYPPVQYQHQTKRLMREEPTNKSTDNELSLNPIETKKMNVLENTSIPILRLENIPFHKKYVITDPRNPLLKAELKRRLRNATERKVILIWHTLYLNEDKHIMEPSICGNCAVTYDKTKISDNSTAAVVFHYLQSANASSMPQRNKRNPNQLYVYWVMESPSQLKVSRHMDLQFEDSYGFNATMGYRQNADFCSDYQFTPIGDIIKKNRLSPLEVLKRKTKVALAVVSDCSWMVAAKTRLKMLKNMKKMNFGLETFGKCVPGSGNLSRNSRDEFSEEFRFTLRMESRKYKFYMAFENSHHCKEYITEKFFNNALASLTVPVVWGAKKEDYERVAPPGSFIFVEDFPTIEKLVEYLIYLDRNDTAYLEYLRWITMRPDEMPQYGRVKRFCEICRALHGINIGDLYNPNYNASNPTRPLFTDGVSHRTAPSLKHWYYEEEENECFEE